MSRNKKGIEKFLSGLNLFFWALALFVWGLIIRQSYFDKPAESLEPNTDPVYVTGSREAPPAGVIENGTRSDTRLLPDEALLAFIIDDFGPAWSQEIVDGFLHFPADITISVIPGNRNSKSVAEAARMAGKEVFIHLPMEPSERIALNERDMVWGKTGGTELGKLLDRAQLDVPGAVGINNHMGSKATANFNLMKMLGREIARRELVFIDSRTSPRSEALTAMHDAGVDALGRDVFLDVEGDSASIAGQINAAARIAHRRGWAIAIGHAKKATLAALTASLPQLERQKLRLVTAGELVRKLSGRFAAEL